jgi:hypothetical protein
MTRAEIDFTWAVAFARAMGMKIPSMRLWPEIEDRGFWPWILGPSLKMPGILTWRSLGHHGKEFEFACQVHDFLRTGANQ